MTPVTMALDVGGTRIKLGLVRDGVVLARDMIAARSHESLASHLPPIVASLDRLCLQTGISRADCAALGMAFPSLMDKHGGRILTHFGKYTDAVQLDLPRWTRETLGLGFAIENDARAALLGEWKAGAGRGSNDLVMVTFGTGLGTAAVIEGQLLRGKHGQAGVQGGHLTVRLGGRACTCGNRGCAEAEASTQTLPELVREFDAGARQALAKLNPIDFAGVFRLAREGNRAAMALREQTIGVWSAMVINLIHAYDPDRIILGGGIVSGSADFMPDLKALVLAGAHTPWGNVEIVRAQLGDDAALVGCELLVRERLLC